LNGTIQTKMDAIQAEMRDDRLGNLRQQEEQLWQSANSNIERGQFAAAETSLNQILALSEGGLRKDDARRSLDLVIPKRKEEETLFAQAKRGIRKKDRESLKGTAALLDRVIQFEGPRKSEAIQLRQAVLDNLNTLQKQERDQRVASLEAGARQDAKQGDFSSARQKANQIREAGGDPSSLSAEIVQAEAAEQAQRQYETNYLQTVQKYKQALAANDKNGVEAARASFLSIAQGGGSHANDANTYLSEIKSRLSAPPFAKAIDEAAVREVIKRYEQAFQQRNIDALRAIWPGIERKQYDRLKNSFDRDISRHVRVEMVVRIMDVAINPDGQRATITALVVQRHIPEGGAPKSRPDATVFQLSKTNGTWVISNVR
jgi:hypothetical protein